ncbi:hypothetical protein B0A50_04669 [Salinomyces thailandicus]|uniref:Uncharacterized protein n=1 Tax=Salinomyces thailandicus TaxID=706561 RepID=A0A4U0TVV8_9PEZI|nr:hypothetical protein B0A50_04669 [Salinomyces thailandica]
MSSYFSLPSFARAKKNRDELEKSNPQNPVLKEEDERFLERQISHSDAPAEVKDETPTTITEQGEEKEASQAETEQAGGGLDQVVVPEEQPQVGDGSQESKETGGQQDEVDDPPELAPEDGMEKAEAGAGKAKREKKDKGFELPSQEEAEASTRNFAFDAQENGKQDDEQQGERKTWSSYLPSMKYGTRKDNADEQTPTSSNQTHDQTSSQQRTWGDYATAAYSSLPALPSLPAWTSKDKDSKVDPVYNEDGTIDEVKTKEKQEREISVLLDHLDMSAINNRVFAFSGETQKIYVRFSEILRDTMSGGPTAYEDMEKLMKDAGPQLEKQFKSMPPFVQTLVKSLPAKLGTTLGPELLAAASEKPGGDMQARMKAASEKRSEAGGDVGISSTPDIAEKDGEGGQKKKRRIPGLKGLVSEQGAVAGILRNVVGFLQTRFPFLASTTNVVMSLAVFILMFVFWYCHKRGREVRLAKEGEEAGEQVEEASEEGEDVEASDDTEDEKAGQDQEETMDSAEAAGGQTEKAGDDVSKQPQSSEVPLPDKAKGEKGAEVEAEKAVGV